ncbi:complex I intermediate-associated protein 30, mitochondrial [Echria macrotheca]|uniref:Complex I intermediate-associated protein 30, mitochondrial n=1 Tax=Echria macrotheca TaxID=438768 RepID=A0AAJ0BJP7_9PEZI|nr:complex I intermediate-associated protein 30, mitochondrial [Echria macrotheca]
MRPTPSLLAKGFWGRSLDEFKRLSDIVIKMEGIKGPSGPYPLFNFHHRESIKDCKIMSDIDIGGASTVNLDWVSPESQSSHPPNPHQPVGYARFHGNISTQLPKDRPEIKRTGYAAWRTKDRGPTMFGRSLWDIDPYSYLALRIKSDGRAYFVNVQTDSVVPTDLHQHRLFTKKPGEWETVLIRWNDFVRTNHGFVVEPQTEILRQKVKSIGIGLTDRVTGPYELFIERVWATNDLSEASAEDAPVVSKEGALKTKTGQKIAWRGQ